MLKLRRGTKIILINYIIIITIVIIIIIVMVVVIIIIIIIIIDILIADEFDVWINKALSMLRQWA